MFDYDRMDIFTEEEVHKLNIIYNDSRSERVKRLHNLFYLEQRIPEHDKTKWIRDKLKKQFKLDCRQVYFLDYTKGSFTRRHDDNSEQSKCTIITLIEKSDDLIGGETIVYNRHWKRNDYEPFDVNRYSRKGSQDDANGDKIIPHVIDLNVGESVVYDGEVEHEVAQVLSGNRKVLVSWLI